MAPIATVSDKGHHFDEPIQFHSETRADVLKLQFRNFALYYGLSILVLVVYGSILYATRETSRFVGFLLATLLIIFDSIVALVASR